MLNTSRSVSRHRQENEGLKSSLLSVAGIPGSISHTKRGCANLEKKLDSEKAMYGVTCDDLWACVNEPNFPAVTLTGLDFKYDDVENPVRTTSMTGGQMHFHEHIETMIKKEVKEIEKQSLHLTSLDEHGNDNCFATHFKGSFGHETWMYKVNYECCCIFVKSKKMCFSMIHTNKSDDEVAMDDNIFFNVYSSSVKGGFEWDNETTCPLAVVVNSKLAAKPMILLEEGENQRLLDFDMNPLLQSMVAYKTVGHSNAVDVVHFKCLKSGCRLATLSRVELSDGSVDFMICRKPRLDGYKRRMKELLDEKKKKKRDGK
jgi:hypothetical protein